MRVPGLGLSLYCGSTVRRTAIRNLPCEQPYKHVLRPVVLGPKVLLQYGLPAFGFDLASEEFKEVRIVRVDTEMLLERLRRVEHFLYFGIVELLEFHLVRGVVVVAGLDLRRGGTESVNREEMVGYVVLMEVSVGLGGTPSKKQVGALTWNPSLLKNMLNCS